MLQVPSAGVTLDICTKCKGAWFDHHELEAIWRLERSRVAARRDGQGADVVAEALLWTGPDLAFFGAVGAAQVTGAAAETAPGFLEGVAEAAGNVFESLVEIVAGLFE